MIYVIIITNCLQPAAKSIRTEKDWSKLCGCSCSQVGDCYKNPDE